MPIHFSNVKKNDKLVSVNPLKFFWVLLLIVVRLFHRLRLVALLSSHAIRFRIPSMNMGFCWNKRLCEWATFKFKLKRSCWEVDISKCFQLHLCFIICLKFDQFRFCNLSLFKNDSATEFTILNNCSFGIQLSTITITSYRIL